MQKDFAGVRHGVNRRLHPCHHRDSRDSYAVAAVPSITCPGRRGLLYCALLALFGCGGTSVSVPPTLPEPLVQRMPLSIGLHLSDDLVRYVHEESLEDSGDWSIALGSAQPTMFRNLLAGMFADVERIANAEQPGRNVDGVLVPSIEEVQFSTPDQTRTAYYEVWIRYRFRLHGRDGNLLGEWPLTAYGKANTRNFGLNSRKSALQAAAVAALRDAMAFFTVQFGTQPAVQSWLKGELEGG